MAKKNETVENEQVEVVKEDTVKVESPIEPTEPKAKEEPKVAMADKSVEQLADEVEAGVYNSGRERLILLGDRYTEVQAEVVRRYKERTKL